MVSGSNPVFTKKIIFWEKAKEVPSSRVLKISKTMKILLFFCSLDCLRNNENYKIGKLITDHKSARVLPTYRTFCCLLISDRANPPVGVRIWSLVLVVSSSSRIEQQKLWSLCVCLCSLSPLCIWMFHIERDITKMKE